jgi:pimeloyl-ACP methyl ester carboxylesterase
VAYVHGFASTGFGEKAKVVEAACIRRGWTFVTFDFRGHGQSSGSLLQLRGSGLLDDLEALRGYLDSRGLKRLRLYGSSMGGWAATWFAVRRPETVAACVLVAPAFHFLRARWDRLSEAERRQWRETGRLRVTNQWIDVEMGTGLLEEIDEFPVAELAARLVSPVRIFHGMLDDVVPFSESIDFLKLTQPASAHKLVLYRDGDHRLLQYKEEIAEAACEFYAHTV